MAERNTEQLHKLFRDIWDEREDEYGYCRCFETGLPMHSLVYRSNTMVYDHILEKSKYPQYKWTKKNIVIIRPDIHTQKTTDIDKTPNLKRYKEELLYLHEIGNLTD